MFVNKVDRRGAAYEHVLQAISERLTRAIVPMGSARELGTRAADFTPLDGADGDFTERLAEVLGERDDSILAAYVEGERGASYGRLREELAAQTRRVLVHPVFFGSALTGAAFGRSWPASASFSRRPSGTSQVRFPAASSRSNEVRRARRSRTSGCSPARWARETGSGSAGTASGR
jgi:hypothetical protein